MKFNFSRLKGRIVEKFGNQHNFAIQLGVKDSYLSNKLNGNIKLTYEDIIKWSSMLDIDIHDIGYYFFAIEVSRV